MTAICFIISDKVQLPTCTFVKMKLEMLVLTGPFCNEAFSVFDYVAMKEKNISK